MPDFVTNRAEMTAIVKRFQSYGNDSMAYSRDHFEKNKCEERCELQGGRLNFYESDKPGDNTITTVVQVEKRRGTNILILRCGPGGRTVVFLEFDSMRITDEWQEALCRYTGQTHVPNPALRRVRSELPAVVRSRRRLARTRSTFPDVAVEQVDSDSEQVEVPSEAPHQEADPLEAPQEAPPDPPVAPSETPQEAPLEAILEAHQEAPPDPPVAPSETPQEASQEAPLKAPPAPPLASHEDPLAPRSRSVARSPSLPNSAIEERVPSVTSETSGNDSRPKSLHSIDTDISPRLADLAKNSVEKECTLSDLQQLKVKDCGGDVMVKEAIQLCHLNVGDKIVLRNDQGLPMNAREITEHIRTSPEPTVVLTIVRGAVCIVRTEECELAINIKGSQTVRLDTEDAIRRACTLPCSLPYAGMPERSNLTITKINNIPVAIGSHPDQISESIREALETSRMYLVLRLIPQSLLDYLTEEEDGTHEEQAHDMVND